MLGDATCPPQSKPSTADVNKTNLRPTGEAKDLMEVQGSHRTLFYRQPSRKHVSSYSTVVVDLEGSSKKVSFVSNGEEEKKEKKEKPSVVITLPAKSEKLATKGTQTDFRESETQTFPWKHKIQTEGKLLAELLSLDWFSLGKHFPLGMEEMMLIEKTRQKLAWEDILEGLRGKENEAKRRSLVLRMTAEENSFREKKKSEETRERLEMSKRQMQEAHKAFEEKLLWRLQRSYVCRRQEDFEKITYWKHQLTRKIRKVKSAKDGLARKPDIISLHEDKTSDLYAPKLRGGENPSLGHEVIDIQCRFLKRFHGEGRWASWGSEGLEILEKQITDFLIPKFFGSTSATRNFKPKNLELSCRKCMEKEFGRAAEEPRDGLSLKIAVAAPSAAREPAKVRSSSEGNLWLEGKELEEPLGRTSGRKEQKVLTFHAFEHV